ncbi:unnamed protein product [Caenorhabditis angaria]|uniref:Thioredoxin domain-containing protein n=1 Tax=Caenorhabditis angaria TaxID=860376 RepID=A0A9P1MZS3_9PELO|nr:unnamed protein product [Caenorhabditis angaria]
MSSEDDRVIEVPDNDQFVRILEKNVDKVVILDFYATWCGPCKAIAPMYKKLSIEYPNIVFLKIDVDECEDICTKYDVKLMPTFVFLKNGEQIDLLEGGVDIELQEKVKKHA